MVFKIDCGSYAIQKRWFMRAMGKERDTTISVSLQEHWLSGLKLKSRTPSIALKKAQKCLLNQSRNLCCHHIRPAPRSLQQTPNMFLQYQAIAVTGFVECSEHKCIISSVLAWRYLCYRGADRKKNYKTQKISIQTKPLKPHWKLQVIIGAERKLKKKVLKQLQKGWKNPTEACSEAI